MLAVLRDRAAPRSPDPGLDSVPTLITAHRELGVEVDAEVDVVPGLPSLLSTTAYRIVSEGLTNARRHGTGERTRLELAADQAGVSIMISNPYRKRRQTRSSGGRGITGMRERAALFGGTVSAGVEPVADGENEWVLRVRLPAQGTSRSGAGPDGSRA